MKTYIPIEKYIFKVKNRSPKTMFIDVFCNLIIPIDQKFIFENIEHFVPFFFVFLMECNFLHMKNNQTL